LTPSQVEFLVRHLYSNVASPKIQEENLPKGRSIYAAQHLMRKLKEQCNVTASESGATETPKATTPRKRKADNGGKAPATPNPKKKAKKSSDEVVSGQSDVESDDEVDEGQGEAKVKVEANGDGSEDEC
jgi:hypothetical protein